MANISSYPLGTPGSGDLIPGTQKVTDVNGETKNLTKNFTVSQVAAFADATAAYTTYVALLTQAGTAAPTAQILQNTTGTTFTWARTGGGTYTVTAADGVFTANKTWIGTGAEMQGGTPKVLLGDWTSTTVVTFVQSDMGSGSSSDVMDLQSVEIRIYS